MGHIVSSCGCQRWTNEDHALHRVDGPAFIGCEKGFAQYQTWYLNGRIHRVGGPAREYHATGHKEWWREDLRLCGKELKVAMCSDLLLVAQECVDIALSLPEAEAGDSNKN